MSRKTRVLKRVRRRLASILHSETQGQPKCYYCGNNLVRNASSPGLKLCNVFKVPISQGGKIEVQNMIFACEICNDNRFRSEKKRVGSLEMAIKKRQNFKEYWEVRTKFISDKPHVCYYCGVDVVELPFTDTTKLPNRLTIDHWLPKGLGGAETCVDNFKICCYLCNNQRSKIQNSRTIESKRNSWNSMRKQRQLKEDFVAFLLYSPLEARCLHKT